MKQTKKWLICFGAAFLTGLMLIVGVVVTIDPFFQYHGPLKGFPYMIDNQIDRKSVV